MSSKAKTVIILFLICVLIAIVPLILIKDSEFGGADGMAEEVIGEINPNYVAWASPIMEPPGGETESLLFCVQAALGAGIFGLCMGILMERNKKEKAKSAQKN